eukprot:CAMPEP_0195309350 /NCGR_PEP_ID=MMETSP0707-20130614/38695_1 /TAXON_ID=33640 /ORGANISM="Asterionellopsis glacialis, Strain CCMP134" /LENGTH=386 /DNA_ID=CAMNT_0040373647 /DNA_START=95 /DNA_END=1255 /DNA_ORIENTATION=-
MASRTSKKYFSKTLRETFPLKCVDLARERRKESKERRSSFGNDIKNVQSSINKPVNHDVDDDDNISVSSGEVRQFLLATDEDSDDQDEDKSDSFTNQKDTDGVSTTTDGAISTTSSCSMPQAQLHHQKEGRRYSARPPLLLLTKAQQQSNKPTALLPLHCNFVIALLNDLYGIQGRGGCSCAGPYGHRLYGIDGDDGRPLSNRVRLLAGKGYEAFKPGWARVNLNYFISDAEAAFIVKAVNQIATHGWKLLPLYVQNLYSGQYFHRTHQNKVPFSLFDISIEPTTNSKKNSTPHIHFDTPEMASSSKSTSGGGMSERSPFSYKQVLQQAMATYSRATAEMMSLGKDKKNLNDFTTDFPDCAHESDVWWLCPSEAREELLRLESQAQ